ncbi:MAG: hypothetical protein DRR04_05370 [Gammaproteobacteria bacterium]|nr:MAG: hypothetical protein DRQ97_06835 [Gammaproteobacteria bacterium]RLA60558.1 MAG: hypothetical protein DRR04_05370 [Gammaproteobacteria bacterium]
MAEATPRKYVYGIILFTLVVVSGISFMSIFGADNPAMLTDKYGEFNESMNQLSSVTDQVGSLESGIRDASTDFGAFGVLNALISSAWQTLKLLGSSLGFMSLAYSAMSSVFGVPAWIPGLIALLVISMIVFTIYSAIFQTEL